MKRLILLSVLLLTSCLPGTAALYGARLAPATIEITATLPGTLIVSGQNEIVSWSGACQRIEISAGPDYSLACDSPQTVRIQTTGRVSTQIVDGWIPRTRPVVID